MNSIDINLVSTGKGDQGKEKKLQKIRIISTGFILVIGLLSVLVFILNISSPLGKIKQQEDSILSQITAQQDRAAKLAIINERITTVSKIYKQRPDYNYILNLILTKKTDNTKLVGMDLGESSVTVSLSSSSLLTLNNFLNSIIDSSKKSEKINSVFLDSLSVSQTSSSYTMAVKINIK